MTIGNPTSSEGELVIGECELTPEGLAWINQFNNSVPNSVRIALELFIMIHGREFRISEFITWLRNYAALIQDELLQGTSTAGATGGSDYMSSTERTIRQVVGQSLTQDGWRAPNPLVEVIRSSSDESSSVRPRRLLTSQEATLPTRNTDYICNRVRHPPILRHHLVSQCLHRPKISSNLVPSLHLRPR